MTERLPCLVPGCKCTLAPAPGDNEGICIKHWKLADRGWRMLYNKRRRLLRADPTNAKHLNSCQRIWWRLKRQAIERAVGIA